MVFELCCFCDFLHLKLLLLAILRPLHAPVEIVSCSVTWQKLSFYLWLQGYNTCADAIRFSGCNKILWICLGWPESSLFPMTLFLCDDCASHFPDRILIRLSAAVLWGFLVFRMTVCQTGRHVPDNTIVPLMTALHGSFVCSRRGILLQIEPYISSPVCM